MTQKVQIDISDITQTFFSFRDDVYIQRESMLEMNISKYTSFSNFLEMLNGSIRINNRTTFSDKSEIGEYSDKRFKFFHFLPAIKGLKPSKNDLLRWKNEDEQLSLAKYVYASSWSSNPDEDYLMWQAYATRGIGVKINTTIKEFLLALKLENCVLVCAEVCYENVPKKTSFERFFLKGKEYKAEREIRFCILPKNIDTTKKRISINIESDFIKSVTLSPFEPRLILDMCRETIQKVKPQLQIHSSKILYGKSDL